MIWKIVLVLKGFLDIEQYVEFKMSVLISPSKSLTSSRWVTYVVPILIAWREQTFYTFEVEDSKWINLIMFRDNK